MSSFTFLSYLAVSDDRLQNKVTYYIDPQWNGHSKEIKISKVH